jgi:uncharacterized protein (TIGR02271 family)
MIPLVSGWSSNGSDPFSEIPHLTPPIIKAIHLPARYPKSLMNAGMIVLFWEKGYSMLNRKDFQNRYPGIREGMDAYSYDGEKLGKVVEMYDDSLTIEKGFFFPKDFTVRYDDVKDVKGDTLILKHDRASFSDWKDNRYQGWDEYDRNAKSDEYRVPVTEEELAAQKVTRQKGEVRVRKVVHTELKSFTVPVTKEEVIVERTPVTSKDIKPGEKTFKDEEIRIPVSEEEVEVTKRPVVKEELRIHKEIKTEQEKVSGEVRKEDVKVDRSDEDKRKAA